jgi:hypothetical protein
MTALKQGWTSNTAKVFILNNSAGIVSESTYLTDSYTPYYTYASSGGTFAFWIFSGTIDAVLPFTITDISGYVKDSNSSSSRTSFTMSDCTVSTGTNGQVLITSSKWKNKYLYVTISGTMGDRENTILYFDSYAKKMTFIK